MRIVAHLDADAFFASVEEKYTPAFRGKPLVVGSEAKQGHGRGVVSTANYKAREYGIHSAMPISQAWQISEEMRKQGKPEVIFLPVDFELYNKSSANILKIIQKYSDLVEPASIDEFYFVGDEKVCKKIKEEIRKKEKITCSVGIGPNKLIAKIAAGEKKPDGLVVIKQKDVGKFLENMPVRKIPGIGPKTEILLKNLKVETVKDLKQFSEQELKNILGKWGGDLYYKARGIDDSPIISEREVKSIGEQATFERDTLGALFIGDELFKMCENVFQRFRAAGFEKCRTIAITVRFSGFETKTSAKSFKEELGVKDFARFRIEALKLILPYLDKRKNPRLKKIRLIGVRMENFGENLPKIRQGRLSF